VLSRTDAAPRKDGDSLAAIFVEIIGYHVGIGDNQALASCFHDEARTEQAPRRPPARGHALRVGGPDPDYGTLYLLDPCWKRVRRLSLRDGEHN
jgi:hypothetical protein